MFSAPPSTAQDTLTALSEAAAPGKPNPWYKTTFQIRTGQLRLVKNQIHLWGQDEESPFFVDVVELVRFRLDILIEQPQPILVRCKSGLSCSENVNGLSRSKEPLDNHAAGV